ncbi:sporulation delaying protein family toxin [Bacillus cereus group sp. BfR-BA-01315]|uniref:sporulation delaying protein family toxin n=1 Tax=Bacillus cereus group sp. BfR-BA-01315 TaxID=2920292 RepID=UPI001F57CF42|nr:sporulation delaying protein family toxin [Bacillus cereus group sp. BfR-BA-01315]
MLFKYQFNKLLLLFALVVLLFTSLVFFNKPYSVNAETEFTGEEIYKGLLFGQGKVAESLPKVWDEKKLTITNSKENKEITNKIIMEMKSIDPTYFKKLKQAINEQDLVEIKRTFENGNMLLNSAIKKLDLNIQKKEQGIGNGAIVSGMVSLSHIQHAVLINPVVTYISFVLPTVNDNLSTLETEELVQEISEKFSS